MTGQPPSRPGLIGKGGGKKDGNRNTVATPGLLGLGGGWVRWHRLQ